MLIFSNLSGSNQNFIKALILGVASSVAMIVILMCLVSAIFTFSALLPYEYLQYIMLAVDGLGVLFGGYVAARVNKSQGLILGLCNGAIIFTALLICGFCMNNSTITIITAIKAIVILLLSALGGIKGVNIKEKIRIK